MNNEKSNINNVRKKKANNLPLAPRKAARPGQHAAKEGKIYAD
jgi:hypothetical protein